MLKQVDTIRRKAAFYGIPGESIGNSGKVDGRHISIGDFNTLARSMDHEVLARLQVLMIERQCYGTGKRIHREIVWLIISMILILCGYITERPQAECPEPSVDIVSRLLPTAIHISTAAHSRAGQYGSLLFEPAHFILRGEHSRDQKKAKKERETKGDGMTRH